MTSCTKQRREILCFNGRETRRSGILLWIFDNKSGLCRFRYGADSLSVHYATENGEQSILLKNGFAGGSVSRNRPQTRVNKRKKAPIFRWMLSGGDKRNRTADLLNAIQALSQLSYTPIFKALSQGRFTIIAKNKSIVKCSTEEKRKCVCNLTKKFKALVSHFN